MEQTNKDLLDVQSRMNKVAQLKTTRQKMLEKMVSRMVNLLEEAGYAVMPKDTMTSFDCGMCSYVGFLTKPKDYVRCPNCGAV